MGLVARIAGTLANLAGVRVRAAGAPVPAPLALTSPRRKVSRSGNRVQQPTTVTRWLQKDVETAQHLAAQGDLSRLAQLYRSLGRDGTYQGLIGTRTNGLVRLPRRFSGSLSAIAYLEGTEGLPGAFERIFPASELALLDADGIVLGVGLGEFVDELVDGCWMPVLRRLDPEFLSYRWDEDAFYYRGATGLERIEPGNGRHVLHTPGGRQEPWARGLVASLARAYVSKEHAIMLRENWNGKLANPARVAFAPSGSTEAQRQGLFQKLLAWGVNTVFGLTPGWDVKLLESNGRGFESFRETIADSNQEIMVAVAGQIVTVTGGSGFANASIHATIRGDLIQGDGQSLGETVSRQGLRPILRELLGHGAEAAVSWDTRPPANRREEAEALSAAARAIGDVRAQLESNGYTVDVRALAQRFAIPELATASAALPSASVEPANDDGEPTLDDVEALATKMTSAGISRCEHGYANRCRLCGVERVRDFELDAAGNAQWRVAWRPIREVAA